MYGHHVCAEQVLKDLSSAPIPRKSLQWFDEKIYLFDETHTRLPNQSAIIIEPLEYFTSFELTSAEHGTPSVEESTQPVPVAIVVAYVCSVIAENLILYIAQIAIC